jgi:hypothetical protein
MERGSGREEDVLKLECGREVVNAGYAEGAMIDEGSKEEGERRAGRIVGGKTGDVESLQRGCYDVDGLNGEGVGVFVILARC